MRSLVIGLGMALGLSLCTTPDRADRPSFSAAVRDYPHRFGLDTLLAQADQYRWGQNFAQAQAAYVRLLGKNLSDSIRLYVHNQLILCALECNDDSVALHWMDRLESAFPDHSRYPTGAQADYFHNKGLLAYHREQFDEALDKLQRALFFYHKTYSPGHLRIAQTLTYIGLAHYDFRQTFDTAQVYLNAADQLFKSNAGLESFAARCEFGMAFNCLTQRDHEQGELHCDNAIRLSEAARPADLLFQARCWSLKGNMLKKKGLFQQADSCFKKSIALARNTRSLRIQQFYSDLIINDTRFAEDTSRFFVHLDSLKALLQTQPERYGHPDRLLGYYYYGKKDWPNTIRCYRQFLDKYSRGGYSNKMLLDEAYYTLSHVYANLGDYDRALRYGLLNLPAGMGRRPVLPEFRQLFSPGFHQEQTNVVVCYAYIANILLKRFQKSGNRTDLDLANRLNELVDKLFFPSIVTRNENENALLTYQKDVGRNFFPSAVETAFVSYRIRHDPGYLDRGFRYCERMKSYILYRDLLLGANPDFNWVDSVRQAKSRIDQLEFMHQQAGGLPPAKARELNVAYQKAQKYAAIQQANTRQYRQQIEQPIPTVKEIQASLRPEEALVQYSLGADKLHIIFISRQEILFEQVLNADSIRSRLRLYQLAASGVNALGKQHVIETAAALHDALIRPIAAALGPVKHLIVIPDQELHLVSFEGLAPSDSLNAQNKASFKRLPYLIRQVNISYASSWKTWNANARKRRDPMQNLRAGAWIDTSLPNWKAEADSLSRIFGKNVRIFTGSNCSKKHFLENYRFFDVLHLSMHAESSPSQRRDNKIFFSAKPEDTLFGFELQGLRFDSTRLVVLSACKTASGVSNNGEGAYTLARSFIYSGVPQVVSTLWEVDYQTNTHLAFCFYRQLKAHGFATALQEAKLSFLRSADEFRANPQYWAGMVGVE